MPFTLKGCDSDAQNKLSNANTRLFEKEKEESSSHRKRKKKNEKCDEAFQHTNLKTSFALSQLRSQDIDDIGNFYAHVNIGNSSNARTFEETNTTSPENEEISLHSKRKKKSNRNKVYLSLDKTVNSHDVHAEKIKTDCAYAAFRKELCSPDLEQGNIFQTSTQISTGLDLQNVENNPKAKEKQKKNRHKDNERDENFQTKKKNRKPKSSDRNDEDALQNSESSNATEGNGKSKKKRRRHEILEDGCTLNKNRPVFENDCASLSSIDAIQKLLKSGRRRKEENDLSLEDDGHYLELPDAAAKRKKKKVRLNSDLEGNNSMLEDNGASKIENLHCDSGAGCAVMMEDGEKLNDFVMPKKLKVEECSSMSSDTDLLDSYLYYSYEKKKRKKEKKKAITMPAPVVIKTENNLDEGVFNGAALNSPSHSDQKHKNKDETNAPLHDEANGVNKKHRKKHKRQIHEDEFDDSNRNLDGSHAENVIKEECDGKKESISNVKNSTLMHSVKKKHSSKLQNYEAAATSDESYSIFKNVLLQQNGGAIDDLVLAQDNKTDECGYSERKSKHRSENWDEKCPETTVKDERENFEVGCDEDNKSEPSIKQKRKKKHKDKEKGEMPGAQDNSASECEHSDRKSKKRKQHYPENYDGKCPDNNETSFVEEAEDLEVGNEEEKSVRELDNDEEKSKSKIKKKPEEEAGREVENLLNLEPLINIEVDSSSSDDGPDDTFYIKKKRSAFVGIKHTRSPLDLYSIEQVSGTCTDRFEMKATVKAKSNLYKLHENNDVASDSSNRKSCDEVMNTFKGKLSEVLNQHASQALKTAENEARDEFTVHVNLRFMQTKSDRTRVKHRTVSPGDVITQLTGVDNERAVGTLKKLAGKVVSKCCENKTVVREDNFEPTMVLGEIKSTSDNLIELTDNELMQTSLHDEITSNIEALNNAQSTDKSDNELGLNGIVNRAIAEVSNSKAPPGGEPVNVESNAKADCDDTTKFDNELGLNEVVNNAATDSKSPSDESVNAESNAKADSDDTTKYDNELGLNEVANNAATDSKSPGDESVNAESNAKVGSDDTTKFDNEVGLNDIVNHAYVASTDLKSPGGESVNAESNAKKHSDDETTKHDALETTDPKSTGGESVSGELNAKPNSDDETTKHESMSSQTIFDEDTVVLSPNKNKSRAPRDDEETPNLITSFTGTLIASNKTENQMIENEAKSECENSNFKSPIKHSSDDAQKKRTRRCSKRLTLSEKANSSAAANKKSTNKKNANTKDISSGFEDLFSLFDDSDFESTKSAKTSSSKCNSPNINDLYNRLMYDSYTDGDETTSVKDIIDEALENVEESAAQTFEESRFLKDLVILIPWEIPVAHTIETRMSSQPSKSQKQKFKELNVPLKLGPYTKEEDRTIFSNFEEFCKVHDIPNDPKPFLNFKHGQKTLLSIKQRINFVQYLGKGLECRMLHSIYRRFTCLCKVQKKGRFTKEEDTIIEKYINNTDSKYDNKKFSTLSKLLNRDRLAVEKRYKYILSKKKIRKNDNRIKNHIPEYLNHLMKILEVDEVEQLKDANITKNVWVKLAGKMKKSEVRVKRVWETILYPRLFTKDPIDTDQMMKQLIHRLLALKKTDYRDINWSELASEFENVTPAYLYQMFRRLVNIRVPERKRHDLSSTLKLLASAYQASRCIMKTQSKMKYENGEVTFITNS